MECSSKMPAPWDLVSQSAPLVSPNGHSQLIFEDLGEIAMGSPLVGKLFLVDDGKRFFISERAGCPAAWSPDSRTAVFPVWTENSFVRGTMQRLALVDLRTRRIVYSKKRFNILEIQYFDGERVKGLDSPLIRARRLDVLVNKMSFINEPPPGSVDLLVPATGSVG